MGFTTEHTTYPIIVPGMGSLENRNPVSHGVGSSDKHNKGRKHHADKERRNFRIRGYEDGQKFTLASATKYVRSGGPERHAQRVARNILRQARLKSNAERRLAQTDRRYDRRILKAAEHFIEAVE